jgi:hypothetical protein
MKTIGYSIIFSQLVLHFPAVVRYIINEGTLLILRAHHLLCILGFRGLGYSEEFAARMARIAGQLRSSPHTVVKVVYKPDEICAPCPFLKDGGCQQKGAQSEEDVRRRDLAVIDKLGLATGDRLPWADITARIKSRMRPEDLDAICGDCQWLSLGYCADGIRALKG